MSDILCIYYSRTGHTRRAVKEIAEALDAEIVAITDGRDRSGWKGYLRSGMDALVAFGHSHDKSALWKSLHYFAIIFIFALGAGIGTQCVGIFGERTIWLSCALLLVSLCFMFIKEDLPEIEEELKK